ncbi:MAG TPA: hypothetical protein VFE33_28110 [Thermoanaerobaculia bacterium]|nr:hypothetical protein [Thermoanaerobaculia bacterium]
MSSLILCGGTGAHVGMTLLRLHTLGEALGFFGAKAEFLAPSVFLVDQDSGDGEQGRSTAWQMVRYLVDKHPARLRWTRPDLVQVSPLPIGPQQNWFQTFSTLETRFESSQFLSILAAERQRAIDYSKGMMGSPAIGALLFKLKEFDARERLNHDKAFGELLGHRGRIVVAGSGVGGTGAAVGPTLARKLADDDRTRRVMAVMVLNWFRFEENEGDPQLRSKAQLRNRLLRENANSALQFYGRRLADAVAAVPVGVPEPAMVKRIYTGDIAQPIQESYIHAVAALCTARHFLREPDGYPAGLYAMGAADPSQLAGGTAIPGGTLQDLANQSATVANLLRVWQKVLESSQDLRLRPRLYDAVLQLGSTDPRAVAQALGEEIAHYEEQIEWLRDELKIAPQPAAGFTREADVRARLRQSALALGPLKPEPEPVATTLLEWTARWVRDQARPENELRGPVAVVGGKHWPERINEAVGVAVKTPGDLTQVPQQDIDAVLSGFIDPAHITCNGWPHPIAALDYFRYAVERGDRAAYRQLELLLLGLVSGTLELRAVTPPRQAAAEISLETLVAVYSRSDYPDFGTAVLVLRGDDGSERIVGFNSPYTLFCPVPFMDDESGNRLWNGLWWKLSSTDDGTPWNDFRRPPKRFGPNDRNVLLLRSWLRQFRRQRAGTAPAWTRVFADYPAPDTFLPFGLGSLLKVFWGADSDAERPLIALQVPTQEAGKVPIPEGLEPLDEAELQASLPELRELTDGHGRWLFQAVDLEIPGTESRLRGYWKDHLDRLQELNKILFWTWDDAEQVVLVTMVGDEPHVTTLPRSRLLHRDLIAIRRWQPLAQQPVFGNPGADERIKLPDLPMRADYLDLVELGEGSLLSALKEGRYDEIPDWSPAEAEKRSLTWRLPLKGRRDPLVLEVEAVPSDPEEEEPQAHWLVWPRMRAQKATPDTATAGSPGWRAYYVFEHCTNLHLRLDTLWLDAEGRVRRRSAGTSSRGKQGPSEHDRMAYPIHYDVTRGRHAGGPPLAFSLRHLKEDEELGVYLVRLESLKKVPTRTAVAIDFGTSHSVAAARLGGGESRVVELLAELAPEHAERGLSLSLSESYRFVFAPDGLLATGGWMPTYVPRGKGFVPSELLLPRKSSAMQSIDTRRWVPGQDFLIPPLEFGRDQLADYLLSDFKWDTPSQEFHGHEGELRTHFLSHFLELVLADVVARHLDGFPEAPVDLTFTYPLRSTPPQVQAFRQSLVEILARAEAATGLHLQLKDGVGLYDESRAARVSAGLSGQVTMVGDLGGGTLDLLISTYTSEREKGRFPDVADSVRLGGNLLLGKLAAHAARYLPVNGGWKKNGESPRDIEAKLRAWMRSEGSPHLFGLMAEKSELPKMGLRGFDRAAEAEASRSLIDRYFRLIVEYMARNLVAYLYNSWYPRMKGDSESLKIFVQLRGNGWRLRYQAEDPAAAANAVRQQVEQRVAALWPLIQGNSYPLPPADCWIPAPPADPEELKLAPVRRVAGEAQRYEDVLRDWHTHTLVDLKVLLRKGARPVPWFSKVPFPTEGSRRVELGAISPPLLLSNPEAEDRFSISSLGIDVMEKINRGLHEEKGVSDPDRLDFRAPVAPLVWEAVFGSNVFLG